MDEVAAELADVLHNGRLALGAVLPEARRGELGREDDGRTEPPANGERKFSPSPPRENEQGNNQPSRPQPIIAKTDFALAAEVMLGGIGKSKELDEWLMGSGESAETADSKNNNNKPMPANSSNNLNSKLGI